MKVLHLLPNALHPEAAFEFHPPKIEALIAESEKGAYLWLKRCSLPKMPVYLLSEHTKDLTDLLHIKEDLVGLISDAGLPCLADPGAALVAKARQKGIAIKAFAGPSSILLALMLSGLPAQKFTFHGYLEREEALLQKQIRSFSLGITHLFIEAPYRNEKLLRILLKELPPAAVLCVALDLTGPNEEVRSDTVAAWQKKPLPEIDRRPAIFLLYRPPLNSKAFGQSETRQNRSELCSRSD